MKTVAIVQARLGSTRFPNKVLKPLGTSSILKTVLDRLNLAKHVDEICCATTDLSQDDAIVREVKNYGFSVFRGSSLDVLDRYVRAARNLKADVVVRVTSDCPCVDPEIVDALIQLLNTKNVCYVSNNMPRSWPIGMDVEVFSRQALELAALSATKMIDREHVSPWMRISDEIRRSNLEAEEKFYPNMRLTIDYPEDYEFFQMLLQYSPDNKIPIAFSDVFKIIQSHEMLLNFFNKNTITEPKYSYGPLK